VLLRRLQTHLAVEEYFEIARPIKIRRDRFLNKPEEFRRHLLLAAAKSSEQGLILILLDADDDCPARLAEDIVLRAKEIIAHRRISVVLANREYEAWFIASANSLNGKRGFILDENAVPADPESVRDAKGWIGKQMKEKRYREILDQPAYSHQMDLQSARVRCRSFRKLCDDLERWVAG